LQTATRMAALPPPVPPGLPSQLLELRPDVFAAEYNFNSAFHLVQSARAARLPSFSLTVGAGYATNDIIQSLALRPWMWTAALNMAAPIYTAGLLQAQVKIADENQKEALLLYGQTALQAFKDVEVTLTNEKNLRDEETQAATALKDTQNALDLALVKYRIGQTDLSPVLQIEYMVIGTQMASASVQYDLIANRINLYLALGGSF
jgi:multidrug efflux system outer membrane protein